MFGILAYNKDAPFAADYFAITTYFFNRSTCLHKNFLLLSIHYSSSVIIGGRHFYRYFIAGQNLNSIHS